MKRLSRRSALRSGVALALTTTVAGCANDVGGVAGASGEIPGVEDGEVVDRHTFANAHGDQLAARRGTVEWARVSLDRETGDPQTHTVWTVRVDGDRVHAVVAGRTLFGNPDADRLEAYFGDDTTVFLRTRTDGEWTTTSGEPHELALSRGSFTGVSMLEVVSMNEVGTETVDGEELHRFSNASRTPDDEDAERYSIQALVDDDALVHSFQQTLDGTQQNERRFDEWYLTGLDATTVERPDWVAEADA